jgi:hypothetical protein
MENIKKKSSLIFVLEFTTSKLLGYMIFIVTSILGYVLQNPEIIIIGVLASSALSGVKNLSESWTKIKIGPNTNITNTESNNTEGNEEKS